MLRGSRVLLSAWLAVACASAVARAEAPLGPPKRPGVWAQTYSDLPAEADVRFGQLPNGLRYAVVRNATPKGQVALRLRIGAGSLQERDDQQGLAHFLEHMAFKGSTHAPNGEMVHILERHGLAFGGDTNAGTSFGETLYQLDLPEPDDATVDTGLMLLREIGGDLTLSPKAVEPERGVVLSEERLREDPTYESAKASLAFLLADQRAPQRWPIGRVETIRTAPASRIREFYETWYRPENAVVIAVGDFDPAVMVRKIEARFGDWRARTPPPAPVDLGAVVARGEAVQLFVAPSAPRELSLAWVRPYDPTADVRARERRDMIQMIGLRILNRRLTTRVRATDSPLVAASASHSDMIRSADVTQVSATPVAGRWREALAAIVEEQRRMLRFGVRRDELDRAIVEMRSQQAVEAAGAGTRTTAALSNELAEIADQSEVFTGPVQNKALFESYVAGLKPSYIDAELHRLFQGSGPLLFAASPEPVEGGQSALKRALDTDLAAPLVRAAAEPVKVWPYTRFGPRSRVASRREIADLGITDVRFANGVRLLVKPTRFATDAIQVVATLGDGRLALPRDRTTPTWAFSTLTEGGTRELTAEEIQRSLSGRVATVGFSMSDDAFRLTGATRGQDLDLQLQLLAAYVTRPGWRAQAFARTRAGLAQVLDEVGATPGGVFSRDASRLLHAGDPRWESLPTPAELAAATPAEAPTRLDPVLANAPVELSIVGDVTVDAAIEAVTASFGALAPRAATAPPPPSARVTHFAQTGGPPVVETHTGRADQAVAFIGWPTQGFYADPHAQRVLYLTAQVIENRLVDRLRVAEGATYSPSVSSIGSQDFPDWGVVSAEVETPPERIAGFYRAIADITGALRAAPPSADELERAKKPMIEQQLKARQSNAFWSGHLARSLRDPRDLDALRSQIADLQSVTAPEIQASVARWLGDAHAWRMEVRPATLLPLSADGAGRRPGG